MGNLMRWFFRVILSELQKREAETREALKRVSAEEEEDPAKRILELPSVLFKVIAVETV